MGCVHTGTWAVVGLSRSQLPGATRSVVTPSATLHAAGTRGRGRTPPMPTGYASCARPSTSAGLLRGTLGDRALVPQTCLRWCAARPCQLPCLLGKPLFRPSCHVCRRTECYQCQRARTSGARPVLSPADEPPSCILRVAAVQVGVLFQLKHSCSSWWMAKQPACFGCFPQLVR